ncbi:transmembrane protein 109, isoform CRA_a [Mus musculus]|nr:transmembrane protein 109, isoform CRA_a [Mus musculus]
MAGAHSTPLWSRHLLKAVLMVLVALFLVHSASAQSHREFASPGQQKKETSADILTQIGRSLKEMLDTWLGPETMHVISEVRKVVPVVAVCRKKRRDIVNATSPHHHIFCPSCYCLERAPPSTNTSWHFCLL